LIFDVRSLSWIGQHVKLVSYHHVTSSCQKSARLNTEYTKHISHRTTNTTTEKKLNQSL